MNKKLYLFMFFLLQINFVYSIEIYVGSYVGNGVDNRVVTGIGFQADVIMIIGSNQPVEGWCWKSSIMGGDSCLRMGLNAVAILNGIKTITSDGFTVGSADYANKNYNYYPFIAFRDNGAGDMCQGRYTGNGVDNRNIVITDPTLAYSVVVVQSMTAAARAVWKSTNSGGDTCFGFVENGGNLFPNYIQATGIGTFQVGTTGCVNANGNKYVYFCIANVDTLFEITRFHGNGSTKTIIMGWDVDFTLCESTGSWTYRCAARIDGTFGLSCSEPLWAAAPDVYLYCSTIDMVTNGVAYTYNTSLYLNHALGLYWCWMANAGISLSPSSTIKSRKHKFIIW